MDKMLLSYTFIVFCEEHHYNPLGLVRSLGEMGIKPIVVGYGGNLHVVCKSKYVKEAYHVESIEEGYQLIISKFKSNERKAFIYTSDDRATEYLDEHYNELIDYFYFYNAGVQGRVKHFMDKNNINVLAKKHGLIVPNAWVVKKGEILEEFEYPVITKAISSNTGAWKKDVYICNNSKELKDAYSRIKSDKLLIQRYIEKENELCIDGCVVNKGTDVLFSIFSLYNYNIPGKYSFDYTSRNMEDSALSERLSAMLREVGFEGIFSIEFLIDKNGNNYFMEINFRNSTWSYSSTRAGMNLPYIWAKGMIYEKIDENALRPIQEKGIRTIAEFDDFKARVIGKKIHLTEWIKIVKSADCHLFYNKEDKWPFWIILIDKLNRIKRLKK